MNSFILHLDLDAFFAAVEVRDNPALKNKPVIIGADPKEGEGRGVVATCNYEAREYGLHSALPISHAYRLCPHGVYLRPNHKKYAQVSKEVMNIINSYSDKFQQVSIDEAYLDISEKCNNFNEAKNIANSIKENVELKIGITLSVGCSSTKSIAKIASDYNKPNGICVVPPEGIKEFLKDMDIIKIPGVGKVTKKHFYKYCIRTIGDLMEIPLHKLIKIFGKHGKWIWKVVNGLDKRKVKEFGDGRKSISKERTFYQNTKQFDLILEKLEEINDKIHDKLIKENISYRTITLKIRFEDFETFTRSKSISYPICDKSKVLEIVLDLYNEFTEQDAKIRLIGIKLSNFERTSKIKQATLMNYIY
ncbi:MAG: DNA polymerase IV [Promethearchaeati archaeon]